LGDRKDERKGGERQSYIALQLYSFISFEHLFIDDFLILITSIAVRLSNCFTYPQLELDKHWTQGL